MMRVTVLLTTQLQLGFELMGIFYCENSNTHKIELIGNDSDFREVLLEFSENIPKAPNEIPQFLTNFKNSKIPNEKISFSPPKDYPSFQKEGVALDYALINNIKYNLLDNTFHFIFDIDLHLIDD